jgi:hypothetical protein
MSYLRLEKESQRQLQNPVSEKPDRRRSGHPGEPSTVKDKKSHFLPSAVSTHTSGSKSSTEQEVKQQFKSPKGSRERAPCPGTRKKDSETKQNECVVCFETNY